MSEKLSSRFKRAWNVFFNKDPTIEETFYSYGGSSYRPDRARLSLGNERSIIASIYSRMTIDASSINIRHVRVDNNKRYVEEIKSGLNNCLTVEANVDQTGRNLIHDVVFSMLDEGCVGLIPVDVDPDSEYSQSINSTDILSMRTGKIIDWYPDRVRVLVYNELTGEKQEVIVKKSRIAIIENPFYSVMNEPNSTLQRLIRKLNLLDAIDNQNGSPKMDLIIQLPYAMRNDAKQKQVEKRRQELEDQLSNSKYGIGYIDATEHITQLNRAVENNLMPQIEYLTNMLYSQLGITPEILNGSADEQVMKNYMERTISPIVTAITEEMERKFLSKTARTQNQAIIAFNDPFKMVPTSQIAEMADKFTRNEILTSNEIRQIIGIHPSDDPRADELRNKNLNQSAVDKKANNNLSEVNIGEEDDEESPLLSEEEYNQTIADLDMIDEQLFQMASELDDELKHYASPYYDPVKAHEYYEEHKKLKGRKSTAGLSDEGKYVKEQLSSEKKSKIEEKSNTVKRQIESSKNQRDTKISSEKEAAQKQIAEHKERMQSQIDQIKTRMKTTGLSTAQKEAMKADIAKLREENSEERAKVQLMYKTTAADLRENHKESVSRLRAELKTFKSDIKTEYDTKYEDELDKIKANPDFQKTSSKSSNSSTEQSSPKLYTGKEYEERLAKIKANKKKK